MKHVVIGASGLVGSALVRELHWKPDIELHKISRGPDLRIAEVALRTLKEVLPADVVYLAAARVGGIRANMEQPAQFLYDNLAIQGNVIEACRLFGCGLVVFLGSSCIYPINDTVDRLDETMLFSGGRLEVTNEAYAISKIAGIKMLESYQKQYRCFESLIPMPCNLFGEEDNFDLETSHLVPALVRRFYNARENNEPSVTLWGTGTPRRELLDVDDLASAIVTMVNTEVRGIVNVGRGEDMPISEIAGLVASASGYEGEIRFDGRASVDGIRSKCLSIELLRDLIDWEPEALDLGIARLCQAYRNARVLNPVREVIV